jgi:hypothetical protein
MGAPIAQGHVGRATLGMTFEDVRAALGEPESTREGGSMLFIHYPDLVITTHEGRVNMLVVESSRVGSTEAGVSVGVSWNELERRVCQLEYDGDQDLWTSTETPGIWYEIASPPRDGEEPIDPPLVAEAYEVLNPEQAVVRRIYVM